MKKLIYLIAGILMFIPFLASAQWIDASNTTVVGLTEKNTDSIMSINGDGKMGYILKDEIAESIIVEDIAALEAYGGEATTLFVKDSLRGGMFNYVASGLTADNGVVFDAADGGFWERQFNKETGQNVLWYGADPTGVSDNASILQELIAHQSYRTGKIYFPKGEYSIESMIGDVHGAENYMIENDVHIYGAKGAKIVVNSSDEILAAIGFEMGTAPTDVTIENIEVHGNNKANRGIYFRHIRDLNTEQDGSRMMIDGVKVFDIFLGTNHIIGSGRAISVYGKFDQTTIQNCVIDGVHTDQTNTIQGIAVAGLNNISVEFFNKKVTIQNNIIKNVFSNLPTNGEQDALHVSLGLFSDNSETSAIITNNTFINCRGRNIKVQSKNVLVENNTFIQEPDMLLYNDSGDPYVGVQYGDFMIIGNTFIFNNLDQNINSSIIGVNNYTTEEVNRGIVSGNKFESDYAIDRFIFFYEDDESPFFKGNITIENNVVSTGVNRFLHFQSVQPSTDERVFTFTNNSIDSISDVFLYNFQERKINIIATGNINYGTPVNISNSYENLLMINNVGFIEENSYVPTTGGSFFGNIGINEASPSQALDITGNVNINAGGTANTNLINLNTTTGTGIFMNIQEQGVDRGRFDYNFSNNQMYIGVTNASGNRVLNALTVMGETDDNFVGINTNSPTERLHVVGNVLADGYKVDGGTSNDFLLGDGTTTTLGTMSAEDASDYYTKNQVNDTLSNYPLYDEGTWSGDFVTSGTGTTPTGTQNYIKVGNQVTIYVNWSGDLSGLTGVISIDNLPSFGGTIPNGSSTIVVHGDGITYPSDATSLIVRTNAGHALFRFNIDGSDYINLSDANITGTTHNIAFTLVYRIEP